MADDINKQAQPLVADATSAKATQTSSISSGFMGLDNQYTVKQQLTASAIVVGLAGIVLFFFRKQLTIPSFGAQVAGDEVDEKEDISEKALVTADSSPDDDEEGELGGSMTFLEHLGELRIRLIRCVIALTLAMIICFIFSDKLIALLIDCVPKDKVQVVTLHPIEAFLTILKLSLVGGLFVAFPVLFYEIWMFIAPGLYKKERRFVLPLAIASWIFFVAGGVFCYLVVFRFALTFFASMAGSAAGNMWGLSNYLNFMIRFLLAFAIVFEEPVIILLLAKVGLVNKAILSKFRPYAIIVMFVLAAIITPPDPFSQLMCAGPLLLLYEFSIIMIGFVEKKKLEEEASG